MQSTLSTNLPKAALMGLLLAMLLIQAAMARPQPAIENQPDWSETEVVPENNDELMEQLRNQLLIARFAPNRYLRSVASSLANGNGWDSLYRSAVMKRQTRSRQCYFNPISCFKK